MRWCQRASLVVGLFMVQQQRASSLPASDAAGMGLVVAPACRCPGGVVLAHRCNMLRGGAGDRRSKSAPSRGGMQKSKSQAQAVPADVTAVDSSSVGGARTLESMAEGEATAVNVSAVSSPIVADDFRHTQSEGKATADGGGVIDVPCLSCGYLEEQRKWAQERASEALYYLFGWINAPGAIGSYCRWRTADYWRALELEITFILCPYLLPAWAGAVSLARAGGAASLIRAPHAAAAVENSADPSLPDSFPALVLWEGMQHALRAAPNPSSAGEGARRRWGLWVTTSRGRRASHDSSPEAAPEVQGEWLWQSPVEGRWVEIRWEGVAAAAAAAVACLLAPRTLLMPVCVFVCVCVFG